MDIMQAKVLKRKTQSQNKRTKIDFRYFIGIGASDLFPGSHLEVLKVLNYAVKSL